VYSLLFAGSVDDGFFLGIVNLYSFADGENRKEKVVRETEKRWKNRRGVWL
jgi:hypothetical protein